MIDGGSDSSSGMMMTMMIATTSMMTMSLFYQIIIFIRWWSLFNIARYFDFCRCYDRTRFLWWVGFRFRNASECFCAAASASAWKRRLPWFLLFKYFMFHWPLFYIGIPLRNPIIWRRWWWWPPQVLRPNSRQQLSRFPTTRWNIFFGNMKSIVSSSFTLKSPTERHGVRKPGEMIEFHRSVRASLTP